MLAHRCFFVILDSTPRAPRCGPVVGHPEGRGKLAPKEPLAQSGIQGVQLGLWESGQARSQGAAEPIGSQICSVRCGVADGTCSLVRCDLAGPDFAGPDLPPNPILEVLGPPFVSMTRGIREFHTDPSICVGLFLVRDPFECRDFCSFRIDICSPRNPGPEICPDVSGSLCCA
jgi:hypothetical protein